MEHSGSLDSYKSSEFAMMCTLFFLTLLVATIVSGCGRDPLPIATKAMKTAIKPGVHIIWSGCSVIHNMRVSITSKNSQVELIRTFEDGQIRRHAMREASHGSYCGDGIHVAIKRDALVETFECEGLMKVYMAYEKC